MADKKNGLETAKISKNEAVRRALAELGREVPLARFQAFIQERFGLEMTTNHISATLSGLSHKEDSADKAAPSKPATALPAAKKEKTMPQSQPAVLSPACWAL